MKWKIHIFVLGSVLICAAGADVLAKKTQQQTALGVHWQPQVRPYDYPEILSNLNTACMRMVIGDGEISYLMDKENAAEKTAFLDNLSALKRRNIEVIITIRWPKLPNKPMKHPDIEYLQWRMDQEYMTWINDRIPQGAERKACLALLDRFLCELGPRIDWYSLGNEVVMGRGKYDKEHKQPDKNDKIPALGWWEDLAVQARKTASREKLSRLKIIAPALSSSAVAAKQAGKLDKTDDAFFDALVHFTNTRTDAMDIHLQVAQAKEITQAVDYLNQLAMVPLVSLEWSQAKALRPWLDARVNNNQMAKMKRFSATSVDPGKDHPKDTVTTSFGEVDTRAVKSGSNRQYLEIATCSRKSVVEWRAYMSTVPVNEKFMTDAYAAMNDAGLLLACYASGQQYETNLKNDPTRSIVPLFATIIVDAYLPKNEPFYSWFANLAKQVNKRP